MRNTMKYTLKKATSLFLAIFLTFATSVPALAAGTEYTFAITANGSATATVQPGGKVSVALVVTKNDGGSFDLYSLQDYVRFDPTYFTLEESSIKVMTESSSGRDVEVFRASPLNFTGNGVDRIFVNRASTEALAIPSGSIQVMTFTLIARKLGSSSLTHDTVEMLSPQVTKYSVTEQSATITIADEPVPPGPGPGPGPAPSPTPAPTPMLDTVTKDDTTITTTEVKPAVKGDTATAVVTEKAITEAMEKAVAESVKQGSSAGVAIEVTAPAEAKKVELIIPKASAQALATGETESLSVHSPIAEIRFDNKALETIAEAAGKDFKLSASYADSKKLIDSLPTTKQEAAKAEIADRPVFNFTITSGNETISDFKGGKSKISIPYLLKPGEKPEGLYVFRVGDDGVLTKLPAVYNGKRSMLTFETTRFSYYAVGYDKLAGWTCPFTDIPTGVWYYKDVTYVAQNGLMKGINVTTFMPTGHITRGMLLAVLHRMSGKAQTVQSTPWYADAVSWAMSEGISDGTAPEREITRQEMATIIYRYVAVMKMDTTPANLALAFADNAEISDFATDGIRYCVNSGIMKGKDQNYFDPKGITQRMELAAVLHRFSLLVTQ